MCSRPHNLRPIRMNQTVDGAVCKAPSADHTLIGISLPGMQNEVLSIEQTAFCHGGQCLWIGRDLKAVNEESGKCFPLQTYTEEEEEQGEPWEQLTVGRKSAARYVVVTSRVLVLW